MKGLILAAGRGTRIQSVHGERPKCLIRLNDDGDTILDQQIENLFSAGVSNIGIVVGYQMNQIVDHVRARYHKFQRRIQFFKNARFAETNNIYSLWLARDWLMDDSFVCLNADVVFDARILTAALQSHRPITMIVDPEWRDETMNVTQSETPQALMKDILRDLEEAMTEFAAAESEIRSPQGHKL